MPGPKRIIFDPDGDVLLRFSCPLAPIAPKDYLCRDSGSEKLAVAKVTNKPQDIAKVTPRKVEMLVSSKHLALVSPVFKAMFRPGFKEGHELSTTGKLNLPLDDDDPTAWEVILNIIHCRLEYVPCRVGLVFMISMSVLADKYQMVAALRYHAKIWIDKGVKLIPTPYDPNFVLPWMAIGWVFKHKEAFYTALHTARRTSTHEIINLATTRRLPIPSAVIEHINSDRQRAIENAIQLINYEIKRVQATPNCRNYVGAFSKKKMMACDSMVIRSLLGSASKLGLWPPSVARSNFGDSSFQSTAAAIRRVTIHTLCDDIFGVRGPLEVNVETRHFTKELLDQQLAKIESRMDRYSLQDLPL
ncbi:uncharacterized protein L3040_005621 [Drepanopeziza brunnea f. sp. 'multigermtubi']|uniref:BTB domain-containing protein n=1 Tax=Marssonina brunnea f. sp. multigermtubi (strain MB_m1) TaxID=1072389 RepID=K1WYR3_MARBU|nr:uncharacterized protein MBM_07964 [Drepanopeziza brunnea f. sp. 'multigermtubi' MB_m1]EKD13763.1 hypothetical protein MBM_07964 [Drepanopeziza brunnea f. sp. 'multigermtubi' MB_m1]KAJ5041065.1 hypothetical protein L3040_005621 [Drepanopeziza brunnea f. sp. 'multigermtubi']